VTNPRATTKTVGFARHYEVFLDGVKWLVPSVSTLKGQLAAPALKFWLENKLIDAAVDLGPQLGALDTKEKRKAIRSRANGDTTAIDIGNRVHEIAEAFFDGTDVPEHPEKRWTLPHVEAFAEAFDVEPAKMPDGRSGVELTLARVLDDGTVAYAGTCDLLADLTIGDEDALAIVDWKSGARVYGDAVLTTAAYAFATHYVDEEGNLVELPERPEMAIVAHLRPQSWTAHPITPSDLEAIEPVWDALTAIYRWRDRYEERAVRPGIR